MRRALILGGGFTGGRVARLLGERGWDVTCTNRSGIGGLRMEVNDPASMELVRDAIQADTVVLHSVPVPGVMGMLLAKPPARLVYLSTTGVYGAAAEVDETTPVAPRTVREQVRVAEEQDVMAGPWQAMVLRPAAIYGPGRGIHASMREGKYELLGEGTNYVSRIHVDDLARYAEAAMMSELTGAYPVADEEPCTSREIAEYCATLLGVPMPRAATVESLGETRRADRRVDASAIRRLLGIELLYKSYREGIAACLDVEARAFSTS
jgi:nucleoside-diphosphate-sugar epimerase